MSNQRRVTPGADSAAELHAVGDGPGSAVDHSSTSRLRRALRRGVGATMVGALTLGLALSMPVAAQSATFIGGGGAGGGGTGSGTAASDFWLYTGDNYDGSGDPPQGWGQTSINSFAEAMERDGSWASGEERTHLNEACRDALDQAIARSKGASARARVVQVGTAVGYDNGPRMAWGGSPSAMTSWYQQLTSQNYWQPDLVEFEPSALNAVRDAFLRNIPERNARVVCIALNETESAPKEYELSLSTDKSAVFSVAGATAAVSDSIRASANGSPIRENIPATVELNWGGLENNPAARTKTVAIANSGTTQSPAFRPSDFGWTSWPAGDFWFDVTVPKQGKMAKAASHAGKNDPRESWKADPTIPRKVLTSGSGGDALADTEVLAAGMFYNAEITARTNGYRSMRITDTISTDKVWIGSSAKDDASQAYVLDPEGQKVSGAKIEISRSGGKVAVSGTVSNIPAAFQAREYTLVVPTYVLPTKADYTIGDDSDVCYTAANTNCLDGNNKQIRKVTPSPDRVWVIDQSGALVAADPAGTNQQGADNKTFAPGAGIGAVVNGSVPTKLAENLSSYSLTDDWTAAAPYIDFSDASKARVFVDGRDVSDQFTITVSGTKTTATAKAAFLQATKGLSKAKAVKLYLGGTFKNTYDTDGKVLSLTNAGSEKWNNETVETNTPAIYTVTPTPDTVWVLDERGALTSSDKDWKNAAGAAQKVFLQNDPVSAVVNGSIPANLGSALQGYTIVDDWSPAARYVDFSEAKRAKVFFNGANVTDQFTVTVQGTKTVATAKPVFLAATKGLAAKGAVKLIVSGDFRSDYDTQGELITLSTIGSESWNNRTEPTNEPAVFVWTPDPNKQVLGSAEESGARAHDDIDGASVWPGQKLEYSVGVDLRIPAGTARGVQSLAVEDVYDPYLVPEKTSVEFWDSRDPKNPRPVPRSAYQLRFNEAEHTFTATFTEAWVKANVGADGANSKWLTPGWLTMRFTGAVSKTIEPGRSVVNQAFQIINGARTATETPAVQIPTLTVDKESLSTDLLDIEGKTLLEGDQVLYRLTMDGGPERSTLAYNVHKLGVVDDYDQEHLTLAAEDITVIEKSTGLEVTEKFNVQVKDGTAYVFAKTVDTAGAYGEIIPGDPQSDDLAAYDAAPIRPLEDPIIDQQLLGKDYWVTLRATVTQVQEDHVLENTAVQNIQNTLTSTRTVSNLLKDIDPTKDVVVSEETQGDSINEAEVKLYSTFNYRLNSSTIPGNRAYGATQWSLSDSFDRVHDMYTGIWAVYANEDIYNGQELIFKKGDLLADSARHEAEPFNDLFAVGFDEQSYTFTIEATQKYLDLVGTRKDLANGFSVYTKMQRIAPSEQVENTVVESYNGISRDSNAAWTFTQENPGVSVEGYTLSEGPVDGDRDDVRLAYEMSPEELALVEPAAPVQDEPSVPAQDEPETEVPTQDETEAPAEAQTVEPSEAPAVAWAQQTGTVALMSAQTVEVTAPAETDGETQTSEAEAPTAAEGEAAETAAPTEADGETEVEGVPEALQRGVEVGVSIVNSGDVPLKNLQLTNTVNEGLHGEVQGMMCAVPFDPTGLSVVKGLDTVAADENGMVWVMPSSVSELGYQQSIECRGTLRGMEPGMTHGSTTQVGGESVFTGKSATAQDAWFAKAASTPSVEIINYTLEEGQEIGDRNTAQEALELTDEQGRDGVRLGFGITNAGDETLQGIALANEADEATTGSVRDVTWLEPVDQPVAGQQTVTVAGQQYLDRPLDELTGLKAGQRVLLAGTLSGVTAGTSHRELASVTATAVYSGASVEDSDPWNGKLAAPPVPPAEPTPAPEVPEETPAPPAQPTPVPPAPQAPEVPEETPAPPAQPTPVPPAPEAPQAPEEPAQPKAKGAVTGSPVAWADRRGLLFGAAVSLVLAAGVLAYGIRRRTHAP